MSFSGKKEAKTIVRSSDGIEFPIDMKAMTQESQVFKKLIEYMLDPEDEECNSDDGLIFPLQIDSNNLQLILNWIEYYKEPVEDSIDIKLESESCIFISKWDFEFIKELTVNQIINLENAAQYLELESLMRLCQRRLCLNLLYSKPSKIRRLMNVGNDFTTAEENTVRKENEWYEDVEGSKF